MKAQMLKAKVPVSLIASIRMLFAEFQRCHLTFYDSIVFVAHQATVPPEEVSLSPRRYYRLEPWCFTSRLSGFTGSSMVW